MARINIYIAQALRTRVKIAAANRGTSISEYCVNAITSELVKDSRQEIGRKRARKDVLHDLSSLQSKISKGHIFSVSSGDLIHEAREWRK